MCFICYCLQSNSPINYDFMALYSEKVGNLPQVTQPADGKAKILTEPAHSLPGGTRFQARIVQRVPRWEGVSGRKIWALVIGQANHSHLRDFVSSSIT